MDRTREQGHGLWTGLGSRDTGYGQDKRARTRVMDRTREQGQGLWTGLGSRVTGYGPGRNML